MKRPSSRKAPDKDKLIDWSTARRVRLPNLKPSTQSISLRLPIHMLERIKAAANARDVPYQSLIKVWLEETLTVRGKLAALDLSEKDIADAVTWARRPARKTRA